MKRLDKKTTAYLAVRALLFLIWICASQFLNAQIFNRIEAQAHFNELKNTMGVAVADYDGDHDLDLFVVAKYDYSPIAPTTWSRLFKNNNDGTFEDVTLEAGFNGLHNFDIVDPGWEYGVKMGAAWGDYNNDGYPDLLLTNYHSIQLFHNRGDGTFEERTEAAGFSKLDSCYNTSALWWDLNKDGFLDLYITRWGGCPNNKFYHNNGDGTFSDKTIEFGLQGNQKTTWMSIPFDFNGDNKWDLYLANDFTENDLLLQGENKHFSNQALKYLANYRGNDMGMTIGDYDNNGVFDIFITNIAENRLLTLNSQGTYENLALDKNVLDTYWAWGTQFADFDLDGDEDLYVANGYQNDYIFYPSKKENFYFKNQQVEGGSAFQDFSVASGLRDYSSSMSMVGFDYDNDGDIDLFVSNMEGSPFFYENKIIDNTLAETPNWINLRLEGTQSNRDGLGSFVKIWIGGQQQMRFYYGAGLLSHNLSGVHFGLGEAELIDSLEISWDSGIVERYHNIPINQTYQFLEKGGFQVLDLQNKKVLGCIDPNSCAYNPAATVDDGSCAYLPAKSIIGNSVSHYLSKENYSYPVKEGSTYAWSVENGHILSGQGTAQIVVQWDLKEKGSLEVIEFNNCASENTFLSVDLSYREEHFQYSIARLWSEALLYAIRNDYARPTVHARNLFHISAAMFDAWAIFDEQAHPYLIGKNVRGYNSSFNGFQAQEGESYAVKKAISYATYRLLKHRFKASPGAIEIQALIDRLMSELGYDINNQSIDYSSGDPAALGNFIAHTYIDYGKQDGSNELGQYNNQYYQAINKPLVTNRPGNPSITHPNRWQPLALETFIDQAGNLIEGSTPEFLSPEWGNVAPFSLGNEKKRVYQRNGNEYQVFYDPGAPPLLDTLGNTSLTEAYKWGFALVSIWGAHLSPYDGINWDISPGSIGNIIRSSLPTNFEDYPEFYQLIAGGDIGGGRSINPSTQLPYEPQIVPRGDYTRVLAEFWADGPDSETPPGHWFTILNKVNEHPQLIKKLGGKGPTMNMLEWDVKAYFILGGTMHDAAIAAWSVKGWYDYIRPISAIRWMAKKGQSSNPNLENYHPEGIPLVEKYIQIVDAEDPLAGSQGEHIGKIKLYTWRGHDFIGDPQIDEAGVGWILAENWMPYQRPSFVTPPFAGYVSGHSTYSRAAAEVLTLLTGDPYFPGGMGEFIAYKNEFLVFEEGPSTDVVLQWATYRDASDQCSLSRIWGGIHPPADDIPGRLIGAELGQDAFSFALPYFYQNSSEQSREASLVYPNPLNDFRELTISNTLRSQLFRLFDLQGRELAMPEQVFNPFYNCTSFKLNNIPAGLYLIQSGKQAWKIVLE